MDVGSGELAGVFVAFGVEGCVVVFVLGVF